MSAVGTKRTEPLVHVNRFSGNLSRISPYSRLPDIGSLSIRDTFPTIRQSAGAMGDFFAELRRRRIFRIGAVYFVVAWGIIQALDALSQLFALPDWIAQPAVIVLVIGFPVTLITAWMIIGAANSLDRTADRLKAHTTDWVLASALIAVLAFMGYQHFFSDDDVAEASRIYLPSPFPTPPAELMVPPRELDTLMPPEEQRGELADFNAVDRAGVPVEQGYAECETQAFSAVASNPDFVTGGMIAFRLLESCMRERGY